jgi:peptidoglycan/LPS O-acetylase OafA/YrhL
MVHYPIIDVLKITAAQAIFWHHICAYGPISEALDAAWPTLTSSMFEHGRVAVHAFLVIAGFLAAAALTRHADDTPLKAIGRRYCRLMPVYLVVLVLTCIAVAICRKSIGGDWLPQPPGITQILAHILLVQDLFAIPALSAGVWYLAIDLQLFGLLSCLAWLLRHARASNPECATSVVVAILTASAMLVFNRHESLDITALYFLGSYGLGFLTQRCRRSTTDAILLGAVLLVGVMAMIIEPRSRLMLAMLTSLALIIGSSAMHATARDTFRPDRRPLPGAPGYPGIGRRLAESSYALFLCHFAWIVVGNATWEILGGANTSVNGILATLIMVVIGIWGLSMVTALSLNRWMESPISAHLVSRLLPNRWTMRL